MLGFEGVGGSEDESPALFLCSSCELVVSSMVVMVSCYFWTGSLWCLRCRKKENLEDSTRVSGGDDG
jgi:hypothetical protein